MPGSALGVVATGTNTDWGDSYTSNCGGGGEADVADDDNPATGTYSVFDLSLTAGQTIVRVIDSLGGGGTYQLGISQL